MALIDLCLMNTGLSNLEVSRIFTQVQVDLVTDGPSSRQTQMRLFERFLVEGCELWIAAFFFEFWRTD